LYLELEIKNIRKYGQEGKKKKGRSERESDYI